MRVTEILKCHVLCNMKHTPKDAIMYPWHTPMDIERWSELNENILQYDGLPVISEIDTNFIILKIAHPIY